MDSTSDRQRSGAIVSVLGSDRPGIVAGVSTVLAHNNISILDITQTILRGTFTMTMLVDLSQSKLEFFELQDALAQLEDELSIQITLQREDVFKFMYRL